LSREIFLMETKAEMTRKESTNWLPATKMWSLILMWCCTLSIPVTHGAAQADKREIVRRATQSSYSLRRLGLLEFKANVQPNWALMTKNLQANPEAMKMLNGLIFSVLLRPDGSVKVEHESSLPIPSAQEENVKQIYGSMDEMLRGFFMTWKVLMLTSPFPAVESEYQLQDLDGEYLLTYKEGNTDISTTMTKELAIEEIRVSSDAFKGSVRPQLTKTPTGYVLVGYQGRYEPTAGPGKTKLDIQIDYQEVNGLQLPRKLSLDAIYDGSPVQMELRFSQYQLKLADSGVPRKSN
jgi:hypothetical protein